MHRQSIIKRCPLVLWVTRLVSTVFCAASSATGLSVVEGHQLVPLRKEVDAVFKFCDGRLECDKSESGAGRIIGDVNGSGWMPRNSWVLSVQHTAEDIAAGINFAERTEISKLHLASLNDGKFSQRDVLGFPIFVLTSPERKDQAAHTESLLRAVKFSGPISVLPLTYSNMIDVDNLETDILHQSCIQQMKHLIWTGEHHNLSRVLNAIDHLIAVRAGFEAEFELFGVFEDNLVLAGDIYTVSQRIAKALRTMPTSADMLYLEACDEICSERRFSDERPLWARTTGSSCSAAVLFTNKGAGLISRMCPSIAMGIDNMYKGLIKAKFVEAYVMVPHAFFQDGFWDSHAKFLQTRGKTKVGNRAVTGITHRPFHVICHEFQNLFNLAPVQISEETPFLRGSQRLNESADVAKIIFVFDLLVDDPMPDPTTTQIAYFTKGVEKDLVEIGRWSSPFGYQGILFHVDSSSICFYTIDKNVCTLVVQTTQLETSLVHHNFVEIADLLIARKNVNELNDVLITGVLSEPNSLQNSFHAGQFSQANHSYDYFVNISFETTSYSFDSGVALKANGSRAFSSAPCWESYLSSIDAKLTKDYVPGKSVVMDRLSVQVLCKELMLFESPTVLEWGSGGSTLFFSRFAQKWHSIEHDLEWGKGMERHLRDTLLLSPHGIVTLQVIAPDHPFEPSSDGTAEEFQTYCSAPGLASPKAVFDLILVDGRARVACALAILRYGLLRDDRSVVVIHDFELQEYHSVLEHYEVIELESTEPRHLVVLRPKKES